MAGNDTKANWSLAISIVSLVASLVTVLINFGQLSAVRAQIQDARDFFNRSGPVLEYETAVQYDFLDASRKDPDPQADNEHPVINRRDIQTFDDVYIQVTLTNVGRAETAITDADIILPEQIDNSGNGAGQGGPGANPGQPYEPGRPTSTGSASTRRTEPSATPGNAEPANWRTEKLQNLPATKVRAKFCSNQGGTRIPCTADAALPYSLLPGKKYYIYFSMKELYPLLQKYHFSGGVKIRIAASGVENGQIEFTTSAHVEI